jgi:hypothetical protein
LGGEFCDFLVDTGTMAEKFPAKVSCHPCFGGCTMPKCSFKCNCNSPSVR